MKKNFGMMFALVAVLGGSLFAGGCVVDDVDDDPDTTVVNPAPAPDAPDVTVTPPAGGSVDIR